MDPDTEPDNNKPLSVREVLASIAAAAVGVRSNRQRERDFRRGSARQFIVTGVLATAVFVLLVYGGVQLVLHFALG